MDTKTLLANARARFNHNSAKAYLAEKYNSKLIVADQGGLWRADPQTITFLATYTGPNTEIVLIDTFNNPVKINHRDLLDKLQQTYISVMEEWHAEWKELENKR
jgi:hypothetical protein